MGKGLANRIGLTWATVGILALHEDCTCTAGRVVSEQSDWSVV